MIPIITFFLPFIRDLFLQHLQDGTWSTLEGCLTVVRDFTDVCYHSYFSVMDDLRLGPSNGKYYEIRLPSVYTSHLFLTSFFISEKKTTPRFSLCSEVLFVII